MSWQDVRGRAHDVIWMARLAARAQARRVVQKSGDEGLRHGLMAMFKVILPFKGTRKRNQVLQLVIDGGDDGQPAVTIGFPEDF